MGLKVPNERVPCPHYDCIVVIGCCGCMWFCFLAHLWHTFHLALQPEVGEQLWSEWPAMGRVRLWRDCCFENFSGGHFAPATFDYAVTTLTLLLLQYLTSGSMHLVLLASNTGTRRQLGDAPLRLRWLWQLRLRHGSVCSRRLQGVQGCSGGLAS